MRVSRYTPLSSFPPGEITFSTEISLSGNHRRDTLPAAPRSLAHRRARIDHFNPNHNSLGQLECTGCE